MKTYNIPVEATLEVIGGKWKVVILCHLKRNKRTSELKRLMPGITQKINTNNYGTRRRWCNPKEGI